MLAVAGAANANNYTLPISVGSSGTQTGGYIGVVTPAQIVGGFFNDAATFTLTLPGSLDAQASTILLGGLANINFSQVYLDILDAAHTFTITQNADGTEKAVLVPPVNVGVGTHTIFVRGTLAGDIGSYGATVNVAAAPGVPEPATWGMMILGMGMIGYGLRMRRRGLSAAA
jgi:hypothetical protein